ncbi:hypothetical protein [Dermacoccus sp. PE3]|uniref:hypothetical protein n=1 Tax=Dermacoccus sp. PE3 TaxID=1641401 RepID=UPI000A8D2075|nr:hypothetical protein [Dermacoccus sp. PE3]
MRTGYVNERSTVAANSDAMELRASSVPSERVRRKGSRCPLHPKPPPTSSARYLTREGALLAERTLSPEEQQIAVHRGELQNMLLDTVLERLGSDAVRTGQRVDGSS